MHLPSETGSSLVIGKYTTRNVLAASLLSSAGKGTVKDLLFP